MSRLFKNPSQRSHSRRRPSTRVAAVRVEELLNNPAFTYSVPTSTFRSL